MSTSRMNDGVWRLLSLFDYTGNWSRPYESAGWEVTRVDVKTGLRLEDITPRWIADCGPFQGVLAAPPCTDFCLSGTQYWKDKDNSGRTAESVLLVKRTLAIIAHAEPFFWALENPAGRLNQLIPELSLYGPTYFQPCDFGDPWTKKTGLWGIFNRSLPRSPVEPLKLSEHGSWVMVLGGSSEQTKELRAATPPGFARAFFLANNHETIRRQLNENPA